MLLWHEMNKILQCHSGSLLSGSFKIHTFCRTFFNCLTPRFNMRLSWVWSSNVDLLGCIMTHRVRVVQLSVFSLDIRERQVDGVLMYCPCSFNFGLAVTLMWLKVLYMHLSHKDISFLLRETFVGDACHCAECRVIWKEIHQKSNQKCICLRNWPNPHPVYH